MSFKPYHFHQKFCSNQIFLSCACCQWHISAEFSYKIINYETDFFPLSLNLITSMLGCLKCKPKQIDFKPYHFHQKFRSNREVFLSCACCRWHISAEFSYKIINYETDFFPLSLNIITSMLGCLKCKPKQIDFKPYHFHQKFCSNREVFLSCACCRWHISAEFSFEIINYETDFFLCH
jgi:hypothetical protein